MSLESTESCGFTTGMDDVSVMSIWLDMLDACDDGDSIASVDGSTGARMDSSIIELLDFFSSSTSFRSD